MEPVPDLADLPVFFIFAFTDAKAPLRQPRSSCGRSSRSCAASSANDAANPAYIFSERAIGYRMAQGPSPLPPERKGHGDRGPMRTAGREPGLA